MRYFLDFDRTIFDTDSFKKDHRFPHLFFKPGELKKYLYLDVPAFLVAHDCTIVTYGIEAFIAAKVRNALTDFPQIKIVYTMRKKGHVMRRLCNQEGSECVFVDDAHFQLESVAEKCPTVRGFEIRRDAMAADGRWPVIHSLDELPPSSDA